MNEMAINTYLSIITLNASGLNAPIKTWWLNGFKKRPIHMLSIRDSCQMERHTQPESKGMDKDISWWKWKKSWGSNTFTRQNRLSIDSYIMCSPPQYNTQMMYSRTVHLKPT